MRYELLLLPSFHSGRLSGWIRLRFLPGRPADLSVHDRLPDGRLLMIGTIGKRCTCRDDNLCPAADAFIHSKLLVYCPVLRHRLPPKSRASVHSHKYVHPARTGLPLKPRRIFTRPKNVHGVPEGGCLNERRDRRSHAAANRGVSSGTAFGQQSWRHRECPFERGELVSAQAVHAASKLTPHFLHT